MRPYRAPPQLDAVVDWPGLSLACKYSVSKIAHHRGVAVRQFQSFCQQRLGRAPKGWLRELRKAQAEAWLIGGWSTEYVAAGLDFTDAAHFCGEFKRARGVCPRRWLAWDREPPSAPLVPRPPCPVCSPQ